MNDSPYVQYGCGLSAPATWRNFDASPSLRIERIPLLGRLFKKNARTFPRNVEFGDIVRGLPVGADTCSAVYCSHVLEHLALEDCRAAMRNTCKILKPRGIFRLVLPDLEHEINQYLRNPASDAALSLLRVTLLGQERRPRGPRASLSIWFGNAPHRWMWDYKALAEELRRAGFVDIRRAQFGDFTDPMFRDVEDPGRWNNCLGVECRKDGRA